jgi:ppGpp synthetase/RelA/SpoT-type nucleotidyltranferase
LRAQAFYEGLSNVVARIIEECLKQKDITVHSVQHRAKEPRSFGRKAAIPSETDPNSPKYPNPLQNITDLAAVRVITHLRGTVDAIDSLMNNEFEIVERSDKGEELIEEDRFGYQSVHYLVRISKARSALAEYQRFAGHIAEVQVRTILQHAWAEIEHDIQYRSSIAIPTGIRRRFMALAGMLEIADREFQGIQDDDKELRARAQVRVDRGDLGGVEITPSALKRFLDKRLGSDGRISTWSYDWTVRLLKRFGFRDLKQVEAAIAGYDDDKLSVLATGGRQGQTTRFELMLLAALGERFIELHPWARGGDWFVTTRRDMLKRFQGAEIAIGQYDPKAQEDSGAAQPAGS